MNLQHIFIAFGINHNKLQIRDNPVFNYYIIIIK